MCTGFVRRGRDVICGFNFDVDESLWNYEVYARPDKFYIGIKVGSTVYKAHGVNSRGSFGNIPYMNGAARGVYRRGPGYKRIDLMVNELIGGKLSFDGVLALAEEKEIVSAPGLSFHSLLADAEGRILLVEPGSGCAAPEEDYAAISNFPILERPAELNEVWYGLDRYERAVETLKNSGDGFSVDDGLALLYDTRQEGKWATRVSFVYSRNENAVYYARHNDFDSVTRLAFTR